MRPGISFWSLSAGLGVATWLLYLYLATHNPHVGFVADDALYLLMADIYSPYVTAVEPVYDHVRAHSQLPPFFPLVLALVGGGSAGLSASRVAVATIMLGANLLFFRWLKSRNVPRLHALLLAGSFALLPITLIHVVDIWSEGLYLALGWLALQGFAWAEGQRYSPVSCIAAGMTVACAIATRTVGLALLPALLLLCCRAGLRRGLLIGFSCGFFCAAFGLIDMGSGGVSYQSIVARTYASDPLAGLARQLAGQASALWEALAYDLFQWRDRHWLQTMTLAGLVGLAGTGLIGDLRRAGYAALYAVGYLAIVLVWPFPQWMERFAFPILPLLMFYAYQAVAAPRQSRPRAYRRRGIAALILFMALVLPSWANTAHQLMRPLPDPRLESFRTSRYWLDPTQQEKALNRIVYLAAISANVPDIARHVPPDQCVYTVYPQIVLFAAKRTAWLPPKADRLRAGPPWGCPYFYVVADWVDAYPAFYPLEFIAAHAERIAVHRSALGTPRGSAGGVVAALIKQRL